MSCMTTEKTHDKKGSTTPPPPRTLVGEGLTVPLHSQTGTTCGASTNGDGQPTLPATISSQSQSASEAGEQAETHAAAYSKAH